ncbi:MAG: sigma-54 dependent transcriptional regulator [Bryobacterales bacterium]
MNANLIIVDDEINIRKTLSKILAKQGYSVAVAADAAEALALARQQRFHLLISDLKLPDIDGLSLLREIRPLQPDIQVIVMTAYGTIQTAVEAMRQGAYDYITKPFEPSHLLILIEKALEKHALASDNARLREVVRSKDEYGRLVGSSTAMSEVFRLIDMVAAAPATVLVQGESGVGKEVIARTLHQRSPRSHGPFISLNCGAVPESLLESELFGHERGAFTGADIARAGKIELANGGTLFLDEVGEMSPRTQIEFLRVLDQRELRRLGGSKLIHVDIRVLAATNKRLQDEVAAGKFREDLFYRLNVVPIDVPPLRERKEDIATLAQIFLNEFATLYNKPRKRLGRPALECLLQCAWPGNVRELRNLMERLTVTVNDDLIEAGDLPDIYRPLEVTRPSVEIPLGSTLAAVEELVIRRTLAEVTTHREKAARLLGISPRALHYKIGRYGLRREDEDSPEQADDESTGEEPL